MSEIKGRFQFYQDWMIALAYRALQNSDCWFSLRCRRFVRARAVFVWWHFLHECFEKITIRTNSRKICNRHARIHTHSRTDARMHARTHTHTLSLSLLIRRVEIPTRNYSFFLPPFFFHVIKYTYLQYYHLRSCHYSFFGQNSTHCWKKCIN